MRGSGGARAKKVCMQCWLMCVYIGHGWGPLARLQLPFLLLLLPLLLNLLLLLLHHHHPLSRPPSPPLPLPVSPRP